MGEDLIPVSSDKSKSWKITRNLPLLADQEIRKIYTWNLHYNLEFAINFVAYQVLYSNNQKIGRRLLNSSEDLN